MSGNVEYVPSGNVEYGYLVEMLRWVPDGNVGFVLIGVLSMYQVGMLSVFTCEMLTMYRVSVEFVGVSPTC